MYYVYFLKSLKKTTWTYVGLTNNIKRRLKEHQSGLSTYTKPYLPVVLVSYIAHKNRNTAAELERYFKTGSGIAIMKKRILSDEASA